ncbi:MAG TPA: GNAT family N-acetyltransferase [Bacillota bacterium]|nr:GNAT family N-acetyltransferase [Bacillota bacterium]
MSKDLSFIAGGEELLAEIGTLWEALNKHHTARAPHFADVFAANTYGKRVQSILAHAALGLRVIVAVTDEGEQAGYCISTVNDRRVGEIDSLYVLPQFRRAKLGEALLQRSIEWLNSQEVSRIFLEVAAGNEEVYGFYEKFGFYPAKTVLEQKR